MQPEAAILPAAFRAPPAARRSGRADAVVIVVLALLAAAMVCFSVLTERLNADTLLPAIMSEQRVTWYYWGQNRLGSLWPWLASPIADIRLNFAVQQFGKAMMAALSPLFLLQLVRPALPLRTAYAAALAAPFLVLAPGVLTQFWLEAQPYGTSITLVALAMLVNGRAPFAWPVRAALAGALVLVATWVNLGIVLVTVPAFGLFLLAERRVHQALMLAISLAAYAIVSWHARHFPNPPAYDAIKLKLSQLAGFWAATVKSFHDGGALGLGVAALFAVLVAALVAPRLRPSTRRVALLVLACAAAMLVTGLLNWFALNAYNTRYLSLPLVVMVGAVAVAGLDALAALGARYHLRRPIGAAAGPLALVTVALAVQPTLTPWRVRADAAALAAEALEVDARFIAGEYWVAWPAVFEAIARAPGRPVYGLAFRGVDMIDRIEAAATPGAVTVCAAASAEACIGKIRFDLGRDTLGGRAIDTMFEQVGGGNFGPKQEPFVVLKVRPPS